MWKKLNTGINYDVKTDQELVDFGLKMKAPNDKVGPVSSVKIWVFPNLNGNELAAMAQGHHSY